MVLAPLLSAGCATPAPDGAGTWNRRAAAAYLDQRADWWMGWRQAARDRTFCMSCHTTVPYALARPFLRDSPARQPDARERKIVDNVRTRVHLWTAIEPYYGAHAKTPVKAIQSRGTEAILNALVLADADARAGRLGGDTRLAFDHMWALQEVEGPEAGAWPWLQFDLDPWEGRHGTYFGAALAAMAIATAPDAYASSSDIQPRLGRMRAYLDRALPDQPLSNLAVLVVASARMPDVLSARRRTRIIADLEDAQQRDGGWSLDTIDRTSRWTLRALTARSDGYATGLATLALLSVAGREDPHVARGLAWLTRHQDPASGSWPAHSLNTDSPSPETERFMSDAATAFAVLALAKADAQVR